MFLRNIFFARFYTRSVHRPYANITCVCTCPPYRYKSTVKCTPERVTFRITLSAFIEARADNFNAVTEIIYAIFKQAVDKERAYSVSGGSLSDSINSSLPRCSITSQTLSEWSRSRQTYIAIESRCCVPYPRSTFH